MLRPLLTLVGVTMIVAAIAAPASADPPIVEEFSDTFKDVNPCTGEDHEITLNVVSSIHLHSNNFVLTSKRTGTTDDGFVMDHGVAVIVDSEVVDGTGIFHLVFKDVWRNDSTGEAFIVRAVFVFEASTDTVRVDRLSARCLGS